MAPATRTRPGVPPTQPDTDSATPALAAPASTPPVRLISAEDDTSDKTIAKALGEELRRTREKLGWSRAQLVERLPSGIGDRTLLAYEHGTRQLNVIRLIELSECLEVAATDVLSLALQRAHLHLQHLVLQIDLSAMLDDKNNKFRPMHQWARNRLNETPGGIAEVSPKALRELAAFIGYTREELAKYLATFTPETAFVAATASARHQTPDRPVHHDVDR
jgi:transcriptional regulator with XRE-family HTH domain